MSNKKANIVAVFLLLIMLVLSLASMEQDALTFDELAHIPAGYSYLKYRDYRVNPEHPPLIKSLSALPLVFKNLNFPTESPNWIQKEAPQWWVQFDLGNEFIYRSGNSPREIIYWSRIPMIAVLIFMGWFLFMWSKKIVGRKGAVGVLALFAFSPTLIAHGRLVTTDVGAGLGVLISTYFWINFLKDPRAKNILLAGIFFGLALLFKFSLVLLIPFFILITGVYALLHFEKNRLAALVRYLGFSLLVGIIGIVFVVWPVYSFHVWNYPIERQARDTEADIANHPVPALRDMTLAMTNNRISKPLAQYFRGILMATQRTAWGNTTYFLGEVSAESWLYYFPLIYLFKEPIPLHLLTLAAFAAALFLAIKRRFRSEHIKENFVLFSFIIFLAIYWGAAIAGNLNIGARHLIPTLPFLYILIAAGIKKAFLVSKSLKIKRAMMVFSGILLAWYFSSSLLSFPHYISYYNALAGGTDNGYLRAVDSNYDWGQDFYRLLNFVKENEIEKIHLDYFGGEDPRYWLGEKYSRLDPHSDWKPHGWIAVSVNQLMGGVGDSAHGFDQPTGYYKWLYENNEPAARAGKSIFIYRID